MQTMLASLVVAMSVKDTAYRTGMAAARAEAAKTGQDFEKSGERMSGAINSAAREVNAAAVRMGQGIVAAGERIKGAGIAMTVGLTAPLGLLGKRTKDTAGDFQSSMNRVRSAMLQASPEQIEKLSAAAMDLGPAMGRSAIEAADAIEMLAKNGMSAAGILNGGLAAALRLAVVGQTDLSGAADLTTDVLAQFNKGASDLPAIVDSVSGALDASKMGFDDYRLAIGQTGGVAGGLGYSFEDLNVALAATASYFASGSDAGTSFKTFLTSLSGNSKEAKELIAALGLSFFDATGAALSLGDIAEQLRAKLSGLNDTAKQDALKTIFGTDAMRTAIALMNQGADGIDRVRASIDTVAAEDKLAVLLKGDAAASERLSAETGNLSIQIGNVLLPVMTAFKDALASVVSVLGGMPPWFYTVAVSVGALAASIGPMILAVTTLAKIALPLLLLRLGPVALAFSALINPFGVVIRLLGQLALQAGAASVLGMLGTRMIAFAGPIGLVVGLLTVLVPLLMRTTTASRQYADAQNAANGRSGAASELTNRLALATGKLRQELILKARADQQAAVQAVNAAKANLQAARAALVRAKAEAAQASAMSTIPGMERGGGQVMRSLASERVTQETANMTAALESIRTEIGTLSALNDVVRGGMTPIGTTGLPRGSGGDQSSKTKPAAAGRDIARDNAQYLDELGRLRVAELDALAALSGGYRDQHKADVAAIEEERAAYARSLALDEGLNAAKRAELLAAKDREVDLALRAADQTEYRAIQQESFDLLRAQNEGQQEALRNAADMAETASQRRAAELALLALQRRLQDAQLDLIIATEATGSAAYQNAIIEKDRLAVAYAAREARVRRDTEGPAEAYLRSIDLSAAQLRETTEDMGVSTLVRFNDTLAETATGFLKLGGIAGKVFNDLIADMMRLQVQKLLAPLARGLLGSLGGGGVNNASAGAGFSSIGDMLGGLNFGGGKASGGRVSRGSWYMVGENGPEPFVPDGNGTIVPNGGMKSQPPVVYLDVQEGALFRPVVTGIAGNVSASTTQASRRTDGRRASRRLA